MGSRQLKQIPNKQVAKENSSVIWLCYLKNPLFMKNVRLKHCAILKKYFRYCN